MLAPIRSAEPDPVPFDSRVLDQLIERERRLLRDDVAALPERNQLLDESDGRRHAGPSRSQSNQRHLAVLAVGVVVTVLRPAHFIAHVNHRRAGRQQRQGQEILDLPVAQCLDGRIVGRAFDAAVPAQVVVRAVAIVFAVRLVVLVVVRDEIVQREPVVTGDEIDALLGLALFMAVEIGAPEQPGRDRRTEPWSPFRNRAHVVAEPAVPLLPAVADEAPHLIETGGIPGLGDELGAGEERIRFNVPENRRIGQRTARPRHARGSTPGRTGIRPRASR